MVCSSQRRWADDLVWDEIEWFRSLTNMKLVLKGIQCMEDAIIAYKKGVDGIVISNHGGRNCDTARPTLEVLVEVMDALRSAGYDASKFDVFIDGGVHRGGDIFKVDKWQDSPDALLLCLAPPSRHLLVTLHCHGLPR